MIASILGHSVKCGYYVGILYSSDEIIKMIENGIEDCREVGFESKEKAEIFCEKWNAMYGNGEFYDSFRAS